MDRVAFVFSGQGDQHPGMGMQLERNDAAARDVFARCDRLRPGTSRQCFSGTEAELRETVNTQPCLFAVEMAMAQALRARGLVPSCVAGFSLGELAALTYAQAMTLEDGFSLVCRRGEWMQQAAQRCPTAMAAVLRLSAQQVEEICAQVGDVYPVNYNCPGQIAVSGREERMAALESAVKAAGGRAVPLKVRGGFHSPFMREAAEAFACELDKSALHAPALTVYSDVTGAPYPPEIAPLLSRQIAEPVRWKTVIRGMIAEGVDTFVEIGPGKTLCGLIGRIDRSVRTFAAAGYDDLDALLAEVQSC